MKANPLASTGGGKQQGDVIEIVICCSLNYGTNKFTPRTNLVKTYFLRINAMFGASQGPDRFLIYYPEIHSELLMQRRTEFLSDHTVL